MSITNMSIEGLLIERREGPKRPEGLYLPGEPDVDEAVGETIEAYRVIGGVANYGMDTAEATETVTRAFNELAKPGYDGRLFVRPPRSLSFDTLIAAADGKRPEGVPEACLDELWIPRAKNYSSLTTYKLEGRAPNTPLARLALFNSNPNTGVDPLLHHLDIPADSRARRKYGKDTTQVAEVKRDKKAFEGRHPGYNLDELDHRDFAMLALMGRIRGVKPEDMVLSKGFMRTLRIRRNYHRSIVRPEDFNVQRLFGCVRTKNSRIEFAASYGDPDSGEGVGLSMGKRK